ncbi:DUF5906 domain-containing protein [Brevundimonas sp.]|uniref:DUF5906 domain-containing protein n=1 Tax=Brevundimonas sp. TaxID=1871086 RepID=UPI002D71689D|nr:DUF5906 domain-containing protein [Brevundimonas sp.]HYC66586.1 DUF5906 domain-containing protein [Brevundimonas sp.]
MRSFSHYADRGFRDDLLPILPHDAEIHPGSPSFKDLGEKRGKVPGKKVGDLWFGYKDWTDHTAVPADLAIWQGWGAGIGMQGRRFPALDIDIDEPALAEEVHELATNTLGYAPCRFGNGPRRILVFAGAGFAKRALAFRRASDLAATGQDGGLPVAVELKAPKPQAVEFLATGQQYVVEGIHPKTGQPYRWSEGQSPVEIGAANLMVIQAQQLDEFYDRLEALLIARGYAVVSRREGRVGGAQIAQESLLAPSFGAIRRAMASLPNEVDYDGWLKVGAALKAAAGPENEADALELFLEWSLLWPTNTPEGAEAKWQSLRPPFKVGWDFLSRFATEHGDGSFSTAQYDFDAVMTAPVPGQESRGPLISDQLQAVFDRYVWAERLERFCDMTTGELLTRTMFNVRNSHIGDPCSIKDCAWAVLTRDSGRLQSVKSVTYRPGQGRFVEENLPGLVGRCINQWKDPKPDLPPSATDDDVRVWLQHLKLVIPVQRERDIVLDWLAWILQHPGEKPNWAILIGSTWEGLGKDLVLEPVRTALGADNVREIGAGELMSGWTWWAANTRLVIVQEMHSFERKETMNRLKPLIAAPPHTLPVNKKHERQYEVPNIIACVFFTNMRNALQVSKQDRRYFITWTDDRPREPAYYAELVRWYRAGGAQLAARWLLQRDVTAFDAHGRAPDTEAKQEMEKAGRAIVDEIIEEALADRDRELAHAAFTLDEVADLVARRLGDRQRPTNNKVAAVLSGAGCRKVARLSLGEPPTDSYGPLGGKDMYTVFARAVDADEMVTNDEVRAVYFASRLKADPFS